ncbi:MAG: transcriptional repressor LexA [Clostridiales bacterium]|nr:transcriptional repressor LexA [Clostridiales bacterium]
MSKPSLSPKQAAVLLYLRDTLSGGLPPTVREICNATGIKSTSTVHGILSALEEYGYISRDPKSSRAIRIEGAAPAAQVPLLGKVTAGLPILAVEQIEDYIPYPAADREDGLFALRVSGYSMKNAGILDGDIVVANRDLQSRQGDIVIAMMEDEATVKRLLFENGRTVLMPENPDFEPIYPENPVILGKVVGCMRSYS